MSVHRRSPEDIGEVVAAALADLPGVVAAYLFGSAAAGRATPDSDLDLGVLFGRDRVPAGAQRLELRERLELVTGLDVDLVVLNEASPIIVHQVLRGRRVLDRDPAATVRFIVRTTAEYDDVKRVRRPIERALLKGRTFDG